MKLRNGGDPTNSADWGCMQRFLKSNGSFLYTEGITLDMTYFENDGKSYVIWAQRYIGAHIGLSELYIGEVNAIEPWKLICDPVLICSPDYGWDRYSGEVDEGPFAIKHNGKIFITFSGSGTDDSYCVGLLTAEEGTDILSKESWVKTNYPILTTESVPRQYGPGHNCFTIDEDGNDILIYHARLAQGSRDMSARRIHWAADGTPILNMTDEEELAPQFKNVSITVKVINYK
jgi:GH43 family beta-xylosidase